jgi:N-acetylglutamate synthase-like GNAT family acetyltransferase
VIVSLRGQKPTERIIELLALAQIHRPPEQRIERGTTLAAEYERSPELELWGFEDGGALLGVAGVERLSPREVVLRDLAVHPTARRRGVGRALLASLRKNYPNAKISGFTLSSSAGFYQRCGFEVREDGALPSGDVRYAFLSLPRAPATK